MVAAPAPSVGLPRAIRAGCDRPCVIDVRLVAPPSPILRVATGSGGSALLARGRVLASTGARPVPLTATGVGRRLVGGRAPGRMVGALTVVGTDADESQTSLTRPFVLGPRHPWTVAIGRTVAGRSVNVLLPPRAIRGLVVAALHGDEPATAATVRAALAGLDPQRVSWAVVVEANPDGLARGTRHNRRGVDLNRNFPARDWGRAPALSPGPRAASEPETRALLSLIGRLAPRRLLTVHAPLALVEDPRRGPLARRLATDIDLPLRRNIGYATPGSLGTWAEERRLPEVTLELPPGGVRPATVSALRTALTDPRP